MEKFKNVRKSRKRRNEDDSSSAAKTPRLHENPDELDDEEYEKYVKDLQHEMRRSSPRSGKIIDLMDKTNSRRRKWIRTSRPSSAELMEMFPFLCVEKWVSTCIQCLTFFAYNSGYL